MAFLSPREMVEVALIRPELKDRLSQLMQRFEDATGQKTFVPADGGYRSTSRQAAIYADSLTQKFRAAPAGASMHEYGAAFDLHIEGTGDDAAADHANPLYEKLAQIGESLGLKAGQHFRAGDPDPYHFELNESLDVARANWAGLVKSREKTSGGLLAVLGLIGTALIFARRGGIT